MTVHREPETGIITGARLFRGIEREGPRRGIETLFVAAPTVTVEEIVAQGPKAIYFGAGRLTEINIGVLRHFSCSSGYLVTVESPNICLIESVLEDVSTRLSTLCILTVQMFGPGGEIRIRPAPKAKIVALMNRHPTRFGVKKDDGDEVCVQFLHSQYKTPLNSDYAEDTVIS